MPKTPVKPKRVVTGKAKPKAKPKAKAKKATKQKFNKQYVAIVLDRSGSMTSIQQETVDMFNGQVDELKKASKDIPSKISLVTFSTEVDEPTYWNAAPSKLKKLTTEDYVPDGLTALDDAVAETIKRLQKVKDADAKDVSFLLMIITDGQENNSKEYDPNTVTQMVRDLRNDSRWTVAYMGPQGSVEVVRNRFDLFVGNTLGYAATSQGMKDLGQKIRSSTAIRSRNIKGGQAVNMSYFSDSDKDSK